MSPIAIAERVRLTTSAAAALLVSDFVGYALCSLAALALDWGLLLFLTAAGLDYKLAAGLSFSAGMLLAYGASTTFVFGGRRRHGRLAEALGFFAIGIAGLALNVMLIEIFVAGCGMSVGIAKAPTAGLVFLFNFFARRMLLFSPYARLVRS